MTTAAGRQPASRRSAPIERITPNDMLQLSYDLGDAPAQVGALLLVDGPVPDLATLRETIGARIAAVPRLRQRLQRLPLGCGRPIWVDDAHFDLAAHVRIQPCPAPGDDRALFDLATQLITTPLDTARPLWRLVAVSGLAGGRWAMVVVFHHVLADGLGGLAILVHLVDGAPPSAAPPRPLPPPSLWRLALEAMGGRISALAHLPRTLRRFAEGVAQTLPGATLHAPRNTLNQPTGPRRRLAVVRVPLDAVRTVAHDHAATVNDVVLAAVPAAMRSVLLARGEDISGFVVSVPVAGRAAAGAELGNEVGALPVALPATGDAGARITQTAQIMRLRKQGRRGASAAVLEPAFRVLARLGVVRWLLNRQRMINTFVTNLRGPADRLSFMGAPVLDVVVVNGTTGNVSVAFGVLSYAGSLNISVIADPDVCREHDALTAALQRELDEMVGARALQPAP